MINKIKFIMPYLVLPISLLLYEMATLVVMHSYTFNYIIVPYISPQRALLSTLWFDGWANIIVFFGLAFIFIFELSYLPFKQRYARAFLVTMFMFVIGVYATYISTGYSYGQSGLDFALEGIILSIAGIDVLPLFVKKNYLFVQILGAMSGITIFLIVISPKLFFNMFPGIGWQTHIHAFEFGIIGGIVISSISWSSIIINLRGNFGITPPHRFRRDE